MYAPFLLKRPAEDSGAQEKGSVNSTVAALVCHACPRTLLCAQEPRNSSSSVPCILHA